MHSVTLIVINSLYALLISLNVCVCVCDRAYTKLVIS